MAYLFEIVVIEILDVQLTKCWLKDLHTLDYEFVNISTRAPVKSDVSEAEGSYKTRVATCIRCITSICRCRKYDAEGRRERRMGTSIFSCLVIPTSHGPSAWGCERM